MLNKQLLILTVSQLNRQVKSYLENEIGPIHVQGEISNLSKPSSGHFYFILKDASAQLRCVFFKNRQFNGIHHIKDGQKMIATGSLSLYEARGEYQLIVEELTEAGKGALYQLFEELKIKLTAEGLFDPARKKALPRFPKAIGIISSSTGAALQDILSTLARRFPQAKLYIYPSEVQGINAPSQLIKALLHAQSDKHCDVLILARGGGSIEDLWAFNDEHVVREIANCSIPVISGVGHETDFTLVDFVADYRAETPTAAAIAATPNCFELANILDKTILRLLNAIKRIQDRVHMKLSHLKEKIASPEKAIDSYWQALDYLERQLLTCFLRRISKEQHQLQLCITKLHLCNPKTKTAGLQRQLQEIRAQLSQFLQSKLKDLRYQIDSSSSNLNALSPLATLERGYAIVSKNHRVLDSIEQVNIGDCIEIRLSKGSLDCQVMAIKNE